MTLRKILAIVLCVCAVLSVMVLVAHAAQDNQPAAQKATPTAITETTTSAATTTTKGSGERILETWEALKPYFEWIYQFSFQGLSQVLVKAFQWLLSSVGLNLWQGGLLT